MSLNVFWNRLFRKSQWMQSLGVRGQKLRRRQLRKMTTQSVNDGCAAITKAAQVIPVTTDRTVRSGCLSKLQSLTEQLTALLPFAASKEAARIRAALQIALEAKNTPPIPPPEILSGPGITFYTVYIPTLDGRFYYLSDTDYPAGEIVRIPFGYEDKEIFGIVEKSQRFAFDKTPLPMWKMKYILGKAPKVIADAYHRQQRYAEKTLDLE